MTTKLLVGFLAIGITAAFGAKNTFKVNFVQDSVVDGKTLKAGTYRIAVENGNALMKSGKDSIEVPAHEVTESNKFNSTELTYTDNTTLHEIGVGGTHTKIIFGGAVPTHSGE
ncbi:MAG TPA: hypothetical protein VGG97_16280 [Bryobacteraceae bacterium]|jgi:hypothetical protein